MKVGRDNHPRERQARQLARKKPKRDTYDRILIVTEGEKTEVNYFEEIRRRYRLGSAHIRICGSDYGTSPEKVVEYAIDQCLGSCEWERVFCVIDRDDHDHYVNALASLKAANNKGHLNDLGQPIKFESAPSNPSFELWLLLHFEDQQAHIHRDNVMRKLRTHIPNYEKGDRGMFELTEPLIDEARARAEQQRVNIEHRGMKNPTTYVDELVQVLRSLRSG